VRHQKGLHPFPLLLMSTSFLIYAFSRLIIRTTVFRVALVISRQLATASTLFECGFSFFEVGPMVPTKIRITCGGSVGEEVS